MTRNMYLVQHFGLSEWLFFYTACPCSCLRRVVVQEASGMREDNDGLTSSSIVVMPQAAPAHERMASVDSASSPVTAPSKPSSESGFDSSSMSIISGDSDDELWEDSRAQAPAEGTEYVVLYDEVSSEDD